MKNLILFFLISLIIYSQSNAQSWTEQYSGSIFTLFTISAVDDDVAWTGASGPYVFKTTDGGSSWQNVGAGVPAQGVYTAIFASNKDTVLLAGYNGNPRVAFLNRTTDGGATWTQVLSQNLGFLGGVWMRNGSHGITIGWPIGGRWSIWKTIDGGTTWDSTGQYLQETDPNTYIYENGMFQSDMSIWFGANWKGIYYSSNDGASWTLQTIPGGLAYPSAIWFDSPTHGLATGPLNIIHTSDAGATWTGFPGTDSSDVIRGIAGAGNLWWYVRQFSPRIYFSSNSGANWTIHYTSPSNMSYRHLTKSRNGASIWAVEIDGHISKWSFPNAVTPVSNEIPAKFSLRQNYPNPFNPETRIRYDVLKNSQIAIKVFDILGREVAMPVNAVQNAGTYEVSFDDSSLSTGVYLYRLSADGVVIDTKKMLLVK